MGRMGVRATVAAGIVLAVVLAVSCAGGGLPGGPASTPSSTAAGPVTTPSGGGSGALPGDPVLGRSIYLTGADLSGRPIPRSGGLGMMGSGGCSICHGDDGRGGTVGMMMGRYDVPDIRWSVLSEPMQMDGETEPAYDAPTFARAVRDGIGSDGDHLESIMPRWQLTGSEVSGLIAYLQTL